MGHGGVREMGEIGRMRETLILLFHLLLLPLLRLLLYPPLPDDKLLHRQDIS